MNLDSKEFWIVLFAGVFSIYAGFTVFSRWCLNSPAVPIAKLNQLRVGMTMDEVRQLLGEPRRITTRDGRPEWQFGRPLKRHILVLRFDDQQRVRHFRHLTGYDPEHREIN